MSKFTPSIPLPPHKAPQISEVSEEPAAGAIRVVKLEGDVAQNIQHYEFGKLVVPGSQGYDVNRSKYGPLAITEESRSDRAQRDRRFSINPLLRKSLSIEQEETRVLEQKLAERLKESSEQARVEGEKRGYEAGLERGYAEAYRKFQEEGAGRLARLDAFLKSVERVRAEILDAQERFLMETVFRLVRMLAMKEISADPQYVTRLVKELVSRVEAKDHVRIRIHPENAQTLEMIKAGIETQFREFKNITVETSADVDPIGCIVDTEWSTLDGNIQTQLKNVHEALVPNAPGAAQDPAAAQGGASG